jgi:hypothetical protein
MSLNKASLVLFSVSLKFNLTSVTLKPLGPLATPDCFQFRVVVKFDNADHDGQVRVNIVLLLKNNVEINRLFIIR